LGTAGVGEGHGHDKVRNYFAALMPKPQVMVVDYRFSPKDCGGLQRAVEVYKF